MTNWTMPAAAPAYPLRWTCRASEGLEVLYEADRAAVTDLLASTPFEFMSSSLVFYAGRMLDHDLGATNSWHYSSLSVPVRFRGEVGIWTAFMFVDDAMAMLAGRELLGEAKKWADMDWRRDARACRFELGLLGATVASVAAAIGDPLPASAVTPAWGLPTGVPLLNHRIAAAPDAAHAPVEQVVAVRLQGSFRWSAATLESFTLQRPQDSRLDALLAPLHRFGPREVIAVNFREGGFENGAGAGCSVYPVTPRG
jgi:acetoacetate decarboxylase